MFAFKALFWTLNPKPCLQTRFYFSIFSIHKVGGGGVQESEENLSVSRVSPGHYSTGVIILLYTSTRFNYTQDDIVLKV